MNINLSSNYPLDSDGDVESFGSQIEEHAEIMRGMGFPVIDNATVLVPEGRDYPGSYQVWVAIDESPDHDWARWVYIDTEGVPHYRAVLHTPEEL